jgi:hypothetical protein
MSRIQCPLRYGWVSIWTGILSDKIYGLFALPYRLTATMYYRVFIFVKDLPVLLEHVSLHQRQHMRFIHHRAPTNFLRIVRKHPNQTFRWRVDRTRRSSQLACTIPWPQFSGFLAVGAPKILVYSAPINDLEVLQQWVEIAFQEIRVKPGIFDKVRTYVRQTTECCVEIYGKHAEHLLHKSHEHRPYLSRNWFLDICWLNFFLF